MFMCFICFFITFITVWYPVYFTFLYIFAMTLWFYFLFFFFCVFFFFFFVFLCFFFLMIRRPPRSTLDRSSAASDVYKRQGLQLLADGLGHFAGGDGDGARQAGHLVAPLHLHLQPLVPVSYTHLRAHETVLDLVCRLLLEKKKKPTPHHINISYSNTHLHLR